MPTWNITRTRNSTVGFWIESIAFSEYCMCGALNKDQWYYWTPAMFQEPEAALLLVHEQFQSLLKTILENRSCRLHEPKAQRGKVPCLNSHTRQRQRQDSNPDLWVSPLWLDPCVTGPYAVFIHLRDFLTSAGGLRPTIWGKGWVRVDALSTLKSL